jgi:membrane associated rhomboid family serine protease
MAICILLDLKFHHAASPLTGLDEHAGLLNRFEIWNGAYWGLLTAAFIHVSDLYYVASFQMLLNIVLFFTLAVGIELILGRQVLFALVFFGALVSSSSQLALAEYPFLMGMGLAGVVYTLLGFVLVMKKDNPVFQKIVPDVVIRFMFLWLVLGFFIVPLSPIIHSLWMEPFILASTIILNLSLIVLIFIFFVRLLGWKTWQQLSGWLIVSSAARFLIAAVLIMALIINSFLWSLGHIAQVTGCLFGVSIAYVFFQKRHRVQYALLLFLLVSMAVISVTWLPWKSQWLVARATAAHQRADYSTALDLFGKQLPTEDPQVLNALAWLLATAADDDIRDGERAIKLAWEACVKTSWRVPAYLDTLAAAYAETESWDLAEAQQRLTLKQVDELGLEGNQLSEYRFTFDRNLIKIERREKIRE